MRSVSSLQSDELRSKMRKVDRNHPPEPVARPLACPTCGSRDLTTASTVVTVETYWRCVACGEIWNVARHGASRYQSSGAFRR
jgi:hypothetical protein